MVKLNLDSPATRQFIRFLIVGVMNSLVTLIVIYVCKGLLGVNAWVSNAIGYVAGLINSFIWNRQWVFHSKGHAVAEAVRFGVGFLLCYGLQLFCTWFLTTPMGLGELTWDILGITFTGYAVATLFGMAIYTIANFIYNRVVTFKSR
ncbi:MAG: GtrA family protein [Muribaculaceae bacterium]|nr:GtrA family protein [Muribaculaceae bacterium]